jgi:hypothetical protein
MDRGVLRVSGHDRTAFLQGLVTNDVESLSRGQAVFAGLLSPQGKILFDFFVYHAGEFFLIDAPAAHVNDLLKRLLFYRLRAKAELEDDSEVFQVHAFPKDADLPASLQAYADPRLAALGHRAFVARTLSLSSTMPAFDHEGHRIRLAVPEGGKDYAYGSTFPHEAAFDLLKGVSFKKGCYVGQEVVSRMQHRGTARTRVLAVTADGVLPEGGVDIITGPEGHAAGRLGSVRGCVGIALARVDRVAAALAKGGRLMAGGVPLTLSVPGWANYSLATEPAGVAG